MLAGVVLAASLRSRVGAVLLAALSGLWLALNGPMEGDILLTITADHGLTAADLAGLAGLGLALWQFLRPAAVQTVPGAEPVDDSESLR